VSHGQHPNPNPHDDPATGPVVMTGIVGTLVVIAVVIALVGLYNHTAAQMRERANEQPVISAAQVRAAQLARLHTPRWIDRKKGIVSLPIDEAIRRTSRELAASRDGSGPWSPPPVPQPPATQAGRRPGVQP